jgi:hypothetical protein
MMARVEMNFAFEVERAADGSPVRLHLTEFRPIGRRASTHHSPLTAHPLRAGSKRLAVLRAAMVDAGPVASRVIDGLTDGRGSSGMIADGTLAVSPAMADALIELFTLLAREGRGRAA